jgi:hypothetical protein
MGVAAGLKVRNGEPDEGMLEPRWYPSDRWSNKFKRMVTDRADLTVTSGKDPDVLADGGTSLHDVPGWFQCRDFWIPAGTEYSAEIHIAGPGPLRTSDQTGVEGRHYQLEPQKRMTMAAFKGALDNMARAAAALQKERA